MEDLGVDEVGFAELAGITRKTVYRYLSGRDPKMVHIIKPGLVAYIAARGRRVTGAVQARASGRGAETSST